MAGKLQIYADEELGIAAKNAKEDEEKSHAKPQRRKGGTENVIGDS
jgi:hypothetical protein